MDDCFVVDFTEELTDGAAVEAVSPICKVVISPWLSSLCKVVIPLWFSSLFVLLHDAVNTSSSTTAIQ
jgi:hypothetical protein